MHKEDAASETISKISINESNNSPISGLPSLLDAGIRGIGRFAETKINNYFIRIAFRFLSELGRFTASRSLQKHLNQDTVGLDLLKVGATKALEITLGSAIIDPNRETNYFKRAGKGLLNMISRLGARFAMMGIGLIKKGQLSLNTLIDEFSSRTLCRMLFIKSNNPILGILNRTVEQLAINEWLRALPLSKNISFLNNQESPAPGSSITDIPDQKLLLQV